MRQIFLVTLIVLLGTSFCFAQMPATPKVSPIATTVPETKTVTGKVETVTIADPVKMIKPEITIVDDSGNKTTLSVVTTTKIYDSEWKAITLDGIKKDDSVKVKYTVKGSINEAVSINLKKQ